MNKSQAFIQAVPEEVQYHKAIALPDDEIDETGSGECVFVDMDAPLQNKVIANLCMTVRIKPLNFVRSRGKWFMSFDIMPENGAKYFTFAVELEKEEQALFNAATSAKFGTLPAAWVEARRGRRGERGRRGLGRRGRRGQEVRGMP